MIGRVRVQRAQHAVDRRFDQLGLICFGDIVGLDPGQDIAEQFKLAESLGPVFLASFRGDRDSDGPDRKSNHRSDDIDTHASSRPLSAKVLSGDGTAP